MKEHGHDDDNHSVESDDRENEPAEEMARNSHDWQHSGRWGMPRRKAIPEHCTKHNVRNTADLAGTQTITESGISSIRRVVDLTHHLAKTRRFVWFIWREWDRRLLLNEMASQWIQMQQRTTDALAYASCAVAFVVVSLKGVCETVRTFSKKRDEYSVK